MRNIKTGIRLAIAIIIFSKCTPDPEIVYVDKEVIVPVSTADNDTTIVNINTSQTDTTILTVNYPDNKTEHAEIESQLSFYEPFDNTVYPSFILGLGGEQSVEKFSFRIKSNQDSTKIEMREGGTVLNQPFNQLLFLEKKNTYYSYTYTPLWDYQSLVNLDNPGIVNHTLEFYNKNELVSSQYVRLKYRSINECVSYYQDESGNIIDNTWLFGAYVNEDHPDIDKLLNQCSDFLPLENFQGYAGDVYNQVYSIWYGLQRLGVNYCNITETSNTGKKVYSQYVRFFDQVIGNSQANCVDGTVLFASVLKRIGIEPILVLVPGHMFLGFYSSSEKNLIYLLETTMIGQLDLSKDYESGRYLYSAQRLLDLGLVTSKEYQSYLKGEIVIDGLMAMASLRTFDAAIKYGSEEYNNIRSKLNNEIQYKYLPLYSLREQVSPITRSTLKSIKINGNNPTEVYTSPSINSSNTTQLESRIKSQFVHK